MTDKTQGMVFIVTIRMRNYNYPEHLKFVSDFLIKHYQPDM